MYNPAQSYHDNAVNPYKVTDSGVAGVYFNEDLIL